jgi:hypothetical protein
MQFPYFLHPPLMQIKELPVVYPSIYFPMMRLRTEVGVAWFLVEGNVVCNLVLVQNTAWGIVHACVGGVGTIFSQAFWWTV